MTNNNEEKPIVVTNRAHAMQEAKKKAEEIFHKMVTRYLKNGEELQIRIDATIISHPKISSTLNVREENAS